MRIFSAPADFKNDTVDRYCELNARYQNAAIDETYGQATVGPLAPSGRSPGSIPTVDLRKLEDYVSYSAGKGIDFSYTFNAMCLGNMEFTGGGIKRINRFLADLWRAGIRNLTISLPSLMALARDSGYEFAIKASTIGQINSRAKAAFHKSQGVQRLVVDEDITRDFQRIRRICDVFGDGVEMIVNSLCVKDCPFKMFHYSHEAHFSYARQDVREFYWNRCFLRKSSEWMMPLRFNWVRPEDLGLYEQVGVHRFKIQGRHLVEHGDPIRGIEAYMSGRFEGNLYELLLLFDARLAKASYQPYVENRKLDGYLTPYFDYPDHCGGVCEECGYCEEYAEASMDRGRTEEMIASVQATLRKNDPFKTARKRSGPALMARRVARRALSAMGVKR